MTLKRIAAVLRRARALSRRHRLRLILALRVTVAALSALVLAQALHLKLPLWAILTSLIVTQMSVGRSLKVATDYLLGTVLGAAYGGALAMLVPHDSEWALLLVLALATAPLAFIASFKANFNVLPVTAVIVLLVPAMEHVNPALQRCRGAAVRPRLRDRAASRASGRGATRRTRMGKKLADGISTRQMRWPDLGAAW